MELNRNSKKKTGYVNPLKKKNDGLAKKDIGVGLNSCPVFGKPKTPTPSKTPTQLTPSSQTPSNSTTSTTTTTTTKKTETAKPSFEKKTTATKKYIQEDSDSDDGWDTWEERVQKHSTPKITNDF